MRAFAWAAAIFLTCCGCRACSNCYDYSSPVAEPIDGGVGRAGSNLSHSATPSNLVPVSYDEEFVVSPLADADAEPSDATLSLPWPEFDSEAQSTTAPARTTPASEQSTPFVR